MWLGHEPARVDERICIMADEDKKVEGTGQETQATTEPKADAAPQTEAQQKEQWDKERQFKDELGAANRRESEANTRLQTLQGQTDGLTQQLTAAQVAIEQLKEKQDAGEATATDLDDYDQLVKYVKGVEAKQAANDQAVKRQHETLTAMEAKLAGYEQEATHEKGQRLLDAECDSLEEHFSPKHRNAAVEATTKKFAEFEVDKMPPKAKAAWIRQELQLAYQAEQAKSPDTVTSTTETTDITVDTGEGGPDPSVTDIPEGSSDEVIAAQIVAHGAK